MIKEPTNKELLTAIKENQKAIKENQNSTKEILDAINIFSTETDKRFSKIENKVDNLDAKVNALPTKDYIDEKQAELRGDIMNTIKREDDKLKRLVDVLKKREVIGQGDEKFVLAEGPFPEIYAK